MLDRLNAYSQTLEVTETALQNARFVLLSLNVRDKEVVASGFRTPEQATTAYAGLEAESDEGTDVVLVSVNSIAGLRNAYPNYFFDAERFIAMLRGALLDSPLH